LKKREWANQALSKLMANILAIAVLVVKGSSDPLAVLGKPTHSVNDRLRGGIYFFFRGFAQGSDKSL